MYDQIDTCSQWLLKDRLGPAVIYQADHTLRLRQLRECLQILFLKQP